MLTIHYFMYNMYVPNSQSPSLFYGIMFSTQKKKKKKNGENLNAAFATIYYTLSKVCLAIFLICQ